MSIITFEICKRSNISEDHFPNFVLILVLWNIYAVICFLLIYIRIDLFQCFSLFTQTNKPINQQIPYYQLLFRTSF